MSVSETTGRRRWLESTKSTSESWMTIDEVALERSKSFINALQDLKNLRPQIYSAADYCEKSYIETEQKQRVLDSLKDYVVKALVNAVDHLGTVAYKLTDVVEQHDMDVSTMELKIVSLNQRLHTCQMYADGEGLRQHQLSFKYPEHHKQYELPNCSMESTAVVEVNSEKSHNTVSSSDSDSSDVETPICNALFSLLEPRMMLKLRGTPRSPEVKTSRRLPMRLQAGARKGSPGSPLVDLPKRNSRSTTPLKLPGGNPIRRALRPTKSMVSTLFSARNSHKAGVETAKTFHQGPQRV